MSLCARSSVSLFFVVALVAPGCKPELLPGTLVEDTGENREIIEVLAKYEDAVEARSAERIMTMVASDYFEDGGTPEPGDDYGTEVLKARLEESFSHSKIIHLELFPQHVAHDDDKNLYVVDYRYNQRALLSFPAGDQWVTHTDVNRIVLRPAGEGRYEIVSGL